MKRPLSRRWAQVPLGVLLGLAVGAATLSLIERGGGRPAEAPAAGRLASDCDGPLRDLAIQYVSGAGEIAGATYRDFLGQLPAGVSVYVVCPDRAAFDELCGLAGPVDCRLAPAVVDHPVTCWSRDRWLALQPADAAEDRGRPTVLLRPRSEKGAEAWPARAGDQRVADDLARAIGPAVAARRSELQFDGGDFVADDQTVFVTPEVRYRNVQQTVRTEAALLDRLGHTLGKRVILLADAPPHHAGMFMMTAGDRTVLVGDPSLARRIATEADLLPALGEMLPGGPDFAAATQAKFDAVARQCAAAGYRVVRVPVVSSPDGRTYLTYVNAILDQRDGRRAVFMPVYTRAEPLNAAAEEVWRSVGYEVRRVDCDGCYRQFGTLRCLVSVIRRG